MSSHVTLERIYDRKRLEALRTTQRFLSTVNSQHMYTQVGRLDEGLGALITNIGPYPGMDNGMFLQSRLGKK